MPAKTLAIALVLWGAMCPGAATSQPIGTASPFALTARELDVRIDFAASSLGGSETLHLRNATAAPVSEVPLLLNRLMAVTHVTDAAGDDLPFHQRVTWFEDDSLLQVDAITVSLRHAVTPGDSLTLTARYGGHLVGYVETGSLYIRDRIDPAFTILREDAYAFPAVGVPSRAANRAAAGAPFEFVARVTVPDTLVVATGGVALAPARHDSLVTWGYRSAAPVPFLNIAIAPYHVLARPGLRVFHFAADSAGAAMLDRAVAGAMARYTEWFGPLEGAPALTLIEIPEDWGSQASLTGGILQTADAFRDPTQLPQVYHELSHLWNVADREHPSPRWNEGLAMYLQWRMAAELDGWDGWDARLERLERYLRRTCAPPAPGATVPMARYGEAGLTDLSYAVGMAMFMALDRTLGHAAFDRAYRGFLAQHRRASASGADLIAAFHAVDPAADRVFAEWYTTTRWRERLAAGDSLRTIVAGYARRPGPARR